MPYDTHTAECIDQADWLGDDAADALSDCLSIYDADGYSLAQRDALGALINLEC